MIVFCTIRDPLMTTTVVNLRQGCISRISMLRLYKYVEVLVNAAYAFVD